MRVVAESFWPRGGWGRAFHYVKHRVRRLPDKPHRIARGIFAGVMVSFSPFFGLHFLTAYLLAKLLQANILAALLATFFGNPITFPFIAAICLETGNFILGTEFDQGDRLSVFVNFSHAINDLTDNFWAMFTDETAHWSGLSQFYSEVFLPYLVGGLVPGVIAGLVCYYFSLPIITAYQNRRRGKLKRKLSQLGRKSNAQKPADP